MNKNLIRWIGAYFILDGLFTLILGRKYVRFFRFGRRKSLYRTMIEWLLDLPTWQLRGAGAAEAGLGLIVMSRAPYEYRRFPGQIVLGDHFSGPLGDLTLLVLEKPETANQ